MPNVTKATKPGKTEKRVKLGDIKPGNTFRFPSVSFEEALEGEGKEKGSGFFMVIDTQPKKAGRVTIVSSDGKIVLEKDDDHEVIPHSSRWVIQPAELV
jgi:hypothetical protein